MKHSNKEFSIENIHPVLQYVVLAVFFPIVVAFAVGVWIMGVSRFSKSVSVKVSGFGLNINITSSDDRDIHLHRLLEDGDK